MERGAELTFLLHLFLRIHLIVFGGLRKEEDGGRCYRYVYGVTLEADLKRVLISVFLCMSIGCQEARLVNKNMGGQELSFDYNLLQLSRCTTTT